LIYNTSRAYRTFIIEYKSKIEDEENRNRVEQQQYVWHLCEIFFFTLMYRNTTIAPEFVTWLMNTQPVHLHDPEISKSTNFNQEWWEDIYTLLLHGQAKNVSNLLAPYLKNKGEDFTKLKERIEQLPMMKVLLLLILLTVVARR
jgi:hypothetical protein